MEQSNKKLFLFHPKKAFPRCLEFTSREKNFPFHIHSSVDQGTHARHQAEPTADILLDLLGGAELLLKVRMKAAFIRHDAFDRGTYHPRSSPPFRIHTRPFTPNGALKECRPDKDRKPSSSCFKQCWKMERNIKT